MRFKCECGYHMHDDEHCFAVVTNGLNTFSLSDEKDLWDIKRSFSDEDSDKHSQEYCGEIWRCPKCDKITHEDWEYEPTRNPLDSGLVEALMEKLGAEIIDGPDNDKFKN